MEPELEPGPGPGARPHAARRGLLAELTRLAAEVDRVRASAGFHAFVECMARFWTYSPLNQWLIRRVRPGATRVAGARTWARLGRQVSADQPPIWILAPAGLATGRRFVTVPVFDVAQTEGRPLPTLDLGHHGDSATAPRLERAARRLDIRVVALRGVPGLLGQAVAGEVRIAGGLEPAERAATLAHELAHVLLHVHDPARYPEALRETEAEAVAYVVLRALGEPSKAPAYIAWRGGDGAAVLDSLRRIQEAARRILRAAHGRERRAQAA